MGIVGWLHADTVVYQHNNPGDILHNSQIDNWRFKLQWCETNLLYLNGSDKSDPKVVESINKMKSEIAELEKSIENHEKSKIHQLP